METGAMFTCMSPWLLIKLLWVIQKVFLRLENIFEWYQDYVSPFEQQQQQQRRRRRQQQQQLIKCDDFEEISEKQS